MEERNEDSEGKFQNVRVFHPFTDESLEVALKKMKEDNLIVTGFGFRELQDKFYLFYKTKDMTEPSKEDIIKSRVGDPEIHKEILPKAELSNMQKFIKDYFFLIIVVVGGLVAFLLYNGFI